MTHHHCPKCNQGLDRSLGPQVAPCPATPGALWVQVHDERGIGVSGVPVEVDGHEDRTDAVGLAAFESLADGEYVARLGALPVRSHERFDPPASTELRGIVVVDATVTSAEFELRRWPTLQVRLSAAVEATVTLDEGDGDGDERSVEAKGGTADFGAVKPGTHQIKVKTRASSKGGAALEESTSVELDHGEDGIVDVDLNPVVAPTIDTEVDALVVDGERLRVVLGASQPFGGTGRLEVTAGARAIEVFIDDEPHELTKGALDVESIPASGYVLELRGVEPSALEGVELRWKLQGGDVEVGPPVTKGLTAVRATLVIHDPAGAAIGREAAREEGRIVAGPVEAGTGARAKVTLHCEPSDFEGTLLLRDRAGDGRLALYAEAQGGDALDSPYEREWPAEDVELYVGGLQPSTAHRGDGLELDIVGVGKTVDHVSITVVRATLEVFGPKDGDAEPEALSDDDKREPGRALFVQGWDFKTPRAKVRVHKAPSDAPCTLTLAASGDPLRVYAEDRQEHHEEEVAHALPLSIDPEAFEEQEAIVLWAEAGALPENGPLSLALGIEEVEDECDSIAFAVTQGRVDIDVTWREELEIAGDVDVRLLRGSGDDETVLFEESISPGDAAVSLSVPPASYRVTFVPSVDDERLRIVRGPGPDGTVPEREALVEVDGATPASASYSLLPAYERVQFVAYQLQTGQYKGRDEPKGKKTTQKAAKEDIDRRCSFMRDAIRKAAKQSTIDPSPTTLKIFMAPEFYFRGTMGAYPVESLSEILQQMATLTSAPKYRDWMFVYGSAIGELRSARGDFDPDVPEEEGRIEHVATPDSATTTVVFKCELGLAVEPGMHLVDRTGTIVEIATVEDLGVASGRRRYRVTFDEPLSFASQTPLILDADDAVDQADWDVRVVDVSRSNVVLDLDAPVAPEVGWGLVQGTLRGVIEEVAATGTPDRYRMTVGSLGGALALGLDVTLVDPEQIEIFNVALVQQGGSEGAMRSGGRAALRELLVYKEQISSIDFQGPDYAKQDFYREAHHLGEIRKDDLSKLRPTAGATGPLSENPNEPGGMQMKPNGDATDRRVTEINESGLGGGSVFTMNDITFGLEVCLDHGQGRLAEYYDDHAQAGEPEVQVQLIPSCGMQIKAAHCVTDTLVFNVDAFQQSASADGGATMLTPASTVKAPAPYAVRSRYKLKSYFPDKGIIAVYSSQPTPPASTVA